MAKIWFVSDWHLGHENIIKYCKRPFKDTKEMDEALLTYHNERVKPEDHVYNLGDVTMARGNKNAQAFVDKVAKFNGHKRLIMGNHDHFDIEVYIKAGFEKVVGTGRWFADSIFSHYPIIEGSIGSAKACVHGHTHDQNYPDYINPFTGKIQPYINLSVEQTDFKPICLDELVSIIDKRTNNNVEYRDDKLSRTTKVEKG